MVNTAKQGRGNHLSDEQQMWPLNSVASSTVHWLPCRNQLPVALTRRDSAALSGIGKNDSTRFRTSQVTRSRGPTESQRGSTVNVNKQIEADERLVS